MLRAAVLTVLRSLRHNRSFALLNVAGLAIGMACVILIALFIRDELQVDRFHERADRIVRMDVDFIEGGEVEPSGNTQGILAPTLKDQMPDVAEAVRLMVADPVLRTGDTVIEADEILLADPEVFDVFTFPLVEGDPATALAAPGQIVLTESLARTLFGTEDAVGRDLDWSSGALTVSAVMADVPRHSHLQFDALISLETVPDPGWFFDNWFTIGFTTFVLLQDGVDPEAFDDKLPAFLEDVAGDAMETEGTDLVLHARPLPGLYLTAEEGFGEFGSAATLRILALVALLVLLVACVNFTNLATARSLDRAREVGVRKSLGADRRGLAVQFLTEAVALSLIATVVAVGLVQLALPALHDLTGKPLHLADLGAWWLAIGMLAVGTGLLAGAYPAVMLSGFDPARVLKGRFASGHQGARLRRGLVVVQFAVSVAMIAATVVVYGQIHFMQHRDLGMDLGGDDEQLVVLPFRSDSTVVAQLVPLRERLQALPRVSGVTASLATPTTGQYSAGGAVIGPDGTQQDLSVTMYAADTSYARVHGLRLVSGRFPRPAADSLRDYVLNEAAIRKIGFASPEAALGTPVEFWGMPGEVTGVVRDFHVDGVQDAIEPLAMMSEVGFEDWMSVLTLRVQTADLPETLASVEGIWAEMVPTRPFRTLFLDEAFADQYVAEQQFGTLFAAFSGLAILIACLGLFGLAAHAASTRTKEIGVRRVLGATVPQVIVLLTRGVVGLVALGLVLAAPVVVLGMSEWLDGFAYRISVGWIPLVLAGAVVLALSVATVAGHALRAALADPVRALRSE
ncbi:MAG: ABC transporter permease [Bacteroidota bacterium]